MNVKMSRIKIVIGMIVALVIIAVIVLVVILVVSESNRCLNFVNIPSRLSFNNNDGDVTISWPDSVIFTECNLTYTLRYNVNGGEEMAVETKELLHRIRSLPLCSNLDVRLWASSEGGTKTDEFIERNFTVIPFDVHVTNVNTEDTKDGIFVTWEGPVALKPCEVHYKVEISSSELGKFTMQTDVESITIPNEKFCFMIEILITAVVGSTSTRSEFDVYFEAREMNIQFTQSSEDPDELVITWNHPNHVPCSLTYEVDYITNITESLTVAVPEVRFPFAYCWPAAITIVPHSFAGTCGNLVAAVSTQSPEHVESLGPINVTHVDEGLLFQWAAIPSPVEECEVTYSIEFETDIDTFSLTSSVPSLLFSRNRYCFITRGEVRAVVGYTLGESTRVNVPVALDPVTDLELTTTGNTLIATWTKHPLQQQCAVRYVVTYQHGSATQSQTTEDSTITFYVAYCATTVVTVKATAFYDLIESTEVADVHSGGYPVSLEPPENVRVTEAETSLIVSWNIHGSLAECSNLYIVTGRNVATGFEDTCLGTINCELLLSNLCPNVEIKLKPTALPGEEISLNHACTTVV